MKDLILSSFAYNAFIEIKDSLMAIVYAFFFVQKFRHRVALCVCVFGLSLFFLLDTFVKNGGKLSVPGAAALALLITTAIYSALYYRRPKKKKAVKKPPKEAQK